MCADGTLVASHIDLTGLEIGSTYFLEVRAYSANVGEYEIALECPSDTTDELTTAILETTEVPTAESTAASSLTPPSSPSFMPTLNPTSEPTDAPTAGRDPRCDTLPCDGCIGRRGRCNDNSEEQCENAFHLGAVWCGQQSHTIITAENLIGDKCIKYADRGPLEMEIGSCCGLPGEISCGPGYVLQAPFPDVCGGSCPENWCNHNGVLAETRSFSCVPEEPIVICPADMMFNKEESYMDMQTNQETSCDAANTYCSENDCGDVDQLQVYFATLTNCCTGN